jgi:tRNA-2-methylthio-N6-dimethylallyladenosine synthase
MKKYLIKTFGCNMNYTDSARIAAVCEKCGFSETDEIEKADLIIANSCIVRQKSEDKAVGFVREVKKQDPKIVVAITGCAIGDPKTKKQVTKSPFLDFVFDIKDLQNLPQQLKEFFNFEFESFCGENYLSVPQKIENPAQVAIPITTGCNNFCSYCIIPYARGREISVSMKKILTECREAVKNGAKEITLLGQNVNSYQDENNKNAFPKLLQEVDKLAEFGLSRTKFMSAHPKDFSDETIAVLREMKTFCNHIHLPTQHGSNRILKLMNRNYSVKNFELIIQKIKKHFPTCRITTDIIVGFPDETEEDFCELCDFAEKIKFDFSFTAIYSPRRGTPAAEMENQIDVIEKRRRFHIFDEIIKKHAWANRDKFLQKTLVVLVESAREKNGKWQNIGRSREFLEVEFFSNKNEIGREVVVKIEKRRNYILVGIPIEN